MDTLRIITTYNNQWTDINKILWRNWNILTNDKKVAAFIPDRPRLAARRARNLRDVLTKSHFTHPQVRLNQGMKLLGTFPCGDCNICPYMLTDKMFNNPTDGRTIHLRDYVNCRTRFVTYGLLCSCPKIYVGQTGQELRKRVQQHCSNISLARRDASRGKKLTSVAYHFLQEHGGSIRDLKVIGLSKTWPHPRGGDITKRLLQTRTKWIYDLDCLTPNGLNEELLFTGFYKG